MQLASHPGKYFIPHHTIVKRDGQKIKLRVVFDASASTSSGKSLNDLLYVGPKLQSPICFIVAVFINTCLRLISVKCIGKLR